MICFWNCDRNAFIHQQIVDSACTEHHIMKTGSTSQDLSASFRKETGKPLVKIDLRESRDASVARTGPPCNRDF